MSEKQRSQAAVMVVAGLLAAGILVHLVAGGVFEFTLAKEAVPLRRPLAELPGRFGTYQFVEDVELHESIVRKLGAAEQVTRVFVDEASPKDRPGAAIRLHLAYYTGHESTLRVKHVPEICYVNFGFEGQDTYRGMVRLPDKDVPLSVFRFRAEDQADEYGVAYCFIANGELCGSPEGVLTICQAMEAKTAYFLKVELLLGTMAADLEDGLRFRPEPATQQQVLQASQRFLEALLPELRQLLPAEAATP